MHGPRSPCSPWGTLRRRPCDEHRTLARQRSPARVAKALAVLEWMERCYGIAPTAIHFERLLYACYEAGSEGAAEQAVSIIRHMQVPATACNSGALSLLSAACHFMISLQGCLLHHVIECMYAL